MNSFMLSFAGAMILSGTIGLVVYKLPLDPYTIAFFRCAGGFVTLSLVILATRQWRLKTSSRKELKFLVLGGVALVLNWVALFAAMKMTSISVAVSLYYLAPLFVLVGGAVWLKDKITPSVVLRILMAFIGSILVAGLVESNIHIALGGVLLAIVAAVFYASATLFGMSIQEISSLQTAWAQTGIGALLLLPIIAIPENTFSETNIALLITIGVVHTGVLYMLFFYGIRGMKTSMISLLAYLDPVMALLIDCFILDNHLTGLQMTGVCFIFGALAMDMVLKRLLPGKLSFFVREGAR